MNLTWQFSKLTTASVSCLSTLVLTTIATTPVRANDYAVTYPGTACQLGNHPNANVNRFVQIYNNGTQPITVICPIERRSPSDDNGSNAPWAAVHVNKANNSTLSCTMAGYDTSGRYIGGSPARITSIGRSLYIYPSRPSGRGYYSLYCELPPQSGIWGFVVYK